jgi:hypothetical protein
MAGPAVAEPTARPAAGPLVVPVWVLLDGDTPVRGGVVRIYPGDLHASRASAPVRARPIRVIGGDRQTSASGEALLELARLPRNFTVVVSGGWAGRDRLNGSLSAEVHGYSRGDVVHVNPVDSLVELWRRVDPSVSNGHATRTVHRKLGIPDWVDDVDLQSLDRWFDADVFLTRSLHGNHAVAQIGPELDRLLVSISHGRPTSHFPAPVGRPRESSAHSAGVGGQINEFWKTLKTKSLVKDGFQQLGISTLQWAAHASVEWVLGHLLDEWGLNAIKDFLFPKSAQDVMTGMLKDISAKVTEIHASVESTKKAVAESQLSLLVGQRDQEIAHINILWNDLQFVMTESQNDRLKLYTRDLVARIGNYLEGNSDVAATLNQALSRSLGNNILKAASQVEATKRFFTHGDSMKIGALYDYYSVEQFRLATLLTEYWNTNPERADKRTLPPELLKRNIIDRINTYIQVDQQAQLKPPLPGDKFIDTRHMLMWDANPSWRAGSDRPPAGRPLSLLGSERGRAPGVVCTSTDRFALDIVCGVLGTEKEFKWLIDGWNGKFANPLAFLKAETGLQVSAPAGKPKDWEGHMWLGPAPVKYTVGRFGYAYDALTRLNLTETHDPPHVFTNKLYHFDPYNYDAFAMRADPVKPGTYWWPIG